MSILGNRALRNYVLCIAVREALSADALHGNDTVPFWWASLHRGVAARMLGEQRGLDVGQCFTVGLLLDIGLAALFHTRPDLAGEWEDFLRADPDARLRREQETFGIWSRQFAPVTRPQNSAYIFATDAPVQAATFWYLWPTTTLSYVPGDEMVQVLAFHPKDLGHTSFAGHRLALEAAPDQARLDYLFTVLAGEDQALVESVQRGLKSRSYNPGRIVVDPELSGQAEHALHHFHRLVEQALAA